MLKGFLRIPWLANKKFIIFYYLGVSAIYFFYVYGKRGKDATIGYHDTCDPAFGAGAITGSLYIGGIHLLVPLLTLIKERYGRILACIISCIKIFLSGFMLLPYVGWLVGMLLHLGSCHFFDSFLLGGGSTYGYNLYVGSLLIFHLLSFREIEKTCEISITKIVTPIVFLANIISIPIFIYVWWPDRNLGGHFNSPFLIVFHALVAVFIWWIMTRKWGWFRKKRKPE